MNFIRFSALLLLLQFPFLSEAQNLVYNGDFEQYSTCPFTFSQTTNCNGWRSFTNGTSDYMNCTWSPSNPFGYQVAASGTGYAGGYAFTTPGLSGNTYKEYIAGVMTTPMQVGLTYEVSLSINLSNSSSWGSDDIGIFFYQNGPSSYPTTSLPPVIPQLWFSSFGPIIDTANWTRITGLFYADSAYSNFVIGSWKESANAGTYQFRPGNLSYYKYDSVVVRRASKITIGYNDTSLCAGDILNVPFTVNSSLYFSPGNVFTLQLSNASGSFATPTTLGTITGNTSGVFSVTVPATITPGNFYRIRVKSSNLIDSSNFSLRPISIGVVQVAKPVITANTPACTGQTLNLNAAGTLSGVSYKWMGPNSITSNIQSPIIAGTTAAAAGTYIVTASLFGCSAKDTETIVVNTSPSAIIATSNSPVCQPNPLNLVSTNSSTGAIYSWSGPNSFLSNTQNPTITNTQPTATGDYIVTASMNGCVTKDTVSAIVLAAPTNINATSNSPICEGQNLNLQVTNNTIGVNHNWTGPNSFTSSNQNPVITNTAINASGDYIVTLSLNGCVLKDTINITIHQAPGTPAISTNTPVCNGNTIYLGSSGAVPGSTYNWTGPNGFTSTLQNPAINNANPGMAGIYSVTAGLNICNSPAVNTYVTVLYQPSSVTAYPIPNDTICVGGTIQFVAVASNGGTNPQYKWTKNGSMISGATAISYTASNMITGDKFTAILTPDNTCPDPDTSAVIEVAVLPYVIPSVSITASPGTLISPWQTITFTAVPVNGGKSPAYQWKRNGQNIVGAVNDVWGAYTLSNNDTISVEMFSSEYCPAPASAMSNKIIVAVKTGVNDIKNEDGVVLYPNPNNGSFTLKGNIGTNTPSGFEIINVLGQVVYRGTLSPKNNYVSQTIQLPNTANGIYMLNIHMAKGHYSRRFSIE